MQSIGSQSVRAIESWGHDTTARGMAAIPAWRAGETGNR
jgi:hypothetical protein